MEPRQVYIIYDGRAVPGSDTMDAAVMSTARTLKEARRDARDFGFTCAIYVCDLQKDANGQDEAVNERFVEMVNA